MVKIATSTYIFSIIVVVLVATNFIASAITTEFGDSTNEFDADELREQQSDIFASFDANNSATAPTVTGSESFKAIAGILLWSFGLLPVWLDTIFVVFRIIMYVILVKWIRGVD